MRTLAPAPGTFVDPATKRPLFGSYSGPLPKIDLSPEGSLSDSARWLVDRALRRKKWIYVAISSKDVWVSLAIVRMGYATSAFAFAFDLKSRVMLADTTVVGPPRAAEIADDVHEPGFSGTFGFARASVSMQRGSDRSFEVRARFAGLDLDAVIDESAAPPAISAIAKLGPGMPSATEKRALARARGSLSAGGQTFSLDDAVAGYDYTQGLMPRHTRWCWAYAMSNEIAFNVVQGFVGEAECAAFTPEGVFPIHEPKFEFDRDRPEQPWRLKGDGMDLSFEVGAVHAQHTNLVLVRSKFLQPVGLFRGTMRVGDRDVVLDGVPGVVEDQDVLW